MPSPDDRSGGIARALRDSTVALDLLPASDPSSPLMSPADSPVPPPALPRAHPRAQCSPQPYFAPRVTLRGHWRAYAAVGVEPGMLAYGPHGSTPSDRHVCPLTSSLPRRQEGPWLEAPSVSCRHSCSTPRPSRRHRTGRVPPRGFRPRPRRPPSPSTGPDRPGHSHEGGIHGWRPPEYEPARG